jgi:hypothetical protein
MANGRKTGGRLAGTPNKATADIKALARVHGPAVIAELARMSGLTGEPGAQTEAARVACLKELLDRGYGRATNVLAGDAEQPPITYVIRGPPAVSSVEQWLRLHAPRDLIDAGPELDTPPPLAAADSPAAPIAPADAALRPYGLERGDYGC